MKFVRRDADADADATGPWPTMAWLPDGPLEDRLPEKKDLLGDIIGGEGRSSRGSPLRMVCIE